MAKKKYREVPSLQDLLEGADESTKSWVLDRDSELEQRHVFAPRTPNQERYFHALETATVTLCTGPAGTGKTICACWFAASLLREGRARQILLTRPVVSCGPDIGFLPGDADEKTMPFMEPLQDALEEFFAPDQLARLAREKKVAFRPLQLLRGKSLKDCVIICDEAQNATHQQLQMILTRFGSGCRVVITGDVTTNQTDVRFYGQNPFARVISRLEGVDPEIAVVRLGREDNQRHRLVSLIDAKLADEADYRPPRKFFPGEIDETA